MVNHYSDQLFWRLDMIKKSAVILLSSCFILGSGFTSLADNSNKSGTLNEFSQLPQLSGVPITKRMEGKFFILQ